MAKCFPLVLFPIFHCKVMEEKIFSVLLAKLKKQFQVKDIIYCVTLRLYTRLIYLHDQVTHIPFTIVYNLLRKAGVVYAFLRTGCDIYDYGITIYKSNLFHVMKADSCEGCWTFMHVSVWHWGALTCLMNRSCIHKHMRLCYLIVILQEYLAFELKYSWPNYHLKIL